MKKSIKPFIALCVFIFVVFAFLTLVYVSVKLECEKLTKERVLTEERLGDLKNMRLNLIAENQALSSEERIVKIARDDLGMVRDTKAPLLMTVSKDKIEKISEAINKENE